MSSDYVMQLASRAEDLIEEARKAERESQRISEGVIDLVNDEADNWIMHDPEEETEDNSLGDVEIGLELGMAAFKDGKKVFFAQLTDGDDRQFTWFFVAADEAEVTERVRKALARGGPEAAPVSAPEEGA